jgi:peptidoglycan/LPS O-acetylase OafA/YrhL
MTTDDPLTRGALWGLGVYQLALGAWMALAPASFFDTAGPFGIRNDHYIRDMATWELTLGVVALVAVARPRWRLPVLCVAVVHYALHTVNHLVDVGDADPSWVGPFDLIALTAGALLIWALFRAAERDDARAGR